MRFFTTEWHRGTLNDTENKMAVKAYRRHLHEIEPLLPQDLARFAQEISLHDGRFLEVILARRSSRLDIKLRCGDLQIGYFNIILRYQGLIYTSQEVKRLELIVRNEDTEILSDEIDVCPGSVFRHSLFCYPEHEIALHFSEFTYDVRTLVERDRSNIKGRFRVID